MKKRGRGRRVSVKGRSEGDDQYINMPYNTLHSPAWRSLRGSAVKVWLELRTRFHGGNNGQLILSYEEAASLLGLGKSTVKRALDELQDKGFIVRVREGRWYGRLASEWAVTDKGVDGQGATRAWQQWRPPSVPIRHAKTESGPNTAPSATTTVPPEYRRGRHGAA
jgi:hypothetical protein